GDARHVALVVDVEAVGPDLGRELDVLVREVPLAQQHLHPDNLTLKLVSSTTDLERSRQPRPIRTTPTTRNGSVGVGFTEAGSRPIRGNCPISATLTSGRADVRSTR